MLTMSLLAVLAAAPQCSTPDCIFQLDLPETGSPWADLIPCPDLDGDGLDDLSIVDFGRVRSYSSVTRAQLLSVTSPMIAGRPRWVGDANGNGTDDILSSTLVSGSIDLHVVDGQTGATIYTLVPADSYAASGSTVFYGRLPDLDGDGVDDFWVRSRVNSTSSLRTANVYSTVTGGLIRRLESPGGLRRFAESVTVLDDMNGDGTPEIAVGEDSSEFNPTVIGRVYVMSPVNGALLLDIPGGSGASQGWTEYVQTIGDLDRDGFRDILIRRSGSPAAVEVFSSSTGSMLVRVEDPLPRTTSSSGFFGQTAADVGDVDGDLVPDFVVAGPDSQRDDGVRGGAAFLFSGATGFELWRKFDSNPNRAYGRQVVGLGDVNGDGKGNWAVNDPHGTPGPSSPTLIEGHRYIDPSRSIEFEVAGDLVSTIENGRALDTPGLMEPAIRISTSGPGQFGPAAFDSSPSGPNASGAWPGLLVGSGNLLVVQGDSQQTAPGVFDSPGPSLNGGVIFIELLERAKPASIDLVGLGMTTSATVVVRDANGLGRIITVPIGYTSDAVTNPSRATWTLSLDTLEDQVGSDSTATAQQQPGFDPTRVASLEIALSGPGGIDRLVLVEAGPPAMGRGVIFDTVQVPRGFAVTTTSVGDLNGDGRAEIALANSGETVTSPSVTIHDGLTGVSQLEIPVVRGEAMAMVGGTGAAGTGQLFVGNELWRTGMGAPFQGIFYLYDPVTGQRTARVEGPELGRSFAERVAPLGDLDGDGIRDFAVSAWGYSQNEGRVYVHSGATAALLNTITGTGSGEAFGIDVLGVGDVNGDGLDDIMVPFIDSTAGAGSDWGLRIHSAIDGVLIAERGANDSSVDLSSRLGLLSDVDGDGVNDVVVGSRIMFIDELVIVSGATGLDIAQIPASADPNVRGVDFNVPGDLDGDGARDIVWVVSSGGVRSIRAISGATFQGLFVLDGLAAPRVMAGIGDVNGDGLDDLGLLANDGVLRVGYESSPDTTVCRGLPTSLGIGSRLRSSGSASVSANEFELTVWNVPPSAFVLLMNSQASAPPFGPGSVSIVSDGRLCLSPNSLARHSISFVPSLGSGSVRVDLLALPTSGAPGFVAPATVGETRFFQCWFRDAGGTLGSNLSDTIAVTFEN